MTDSTPESAGGDTAAAARVLSCPTPRAVDHSKRKLLKGGGLAVVGTVSSALTGCFGGGADDVDALSENGPAAAAPPTQAPSQSPAAPPPPPGSAPAPAPAPAAAPAPDPRDSTAALLNTRVTIMGQSNASGLGSRSELSAPPLNSDAGLAAYDAHAFDRVYVWVPSASSFERLRNGMSQESEGPTLFGPEFGIAVRWMRTTSSGNLYIEKQAYGGATIASFQEGLGGSSSFELSKQRRAASNVWLAARGIVVTEAGFLWVQGESDAGATQSYYQAQLEALMNSRIAAGLQSASTRTVIAQMLAGTNNYSSAVAAAKSAYVAAHPASRAITFANYFQPDNLHLTGRGQLQLGYSAHAALFDATPVVV